MICPNCQFQNALGTKFCVSCGQLLDQAITDPSQTTRTQKFETLTQNFQQVMSGPSSTTRTRTIVTILALLFITPLGVPLMFLYSGWSKKAKILVFLVPAVILAIIIIVGVVFGPGKKSGQQSSLDNFNSVNQVAPAVNGTFPRVTQPSTSFSAKQNGQTAAILDNKDSDNDGIPDWAEIGAGMNPNIDQCLPDMSSCGANFSTTSTRPKNLLVVLDDSGSMAERMPDGNIKIDVAKEEIKNLLTTVPPDTNVSLVVYGSHGSNSAADKSTSCAGIDLLYPLTGTNKDKITQTLSSFQPTGWTPIAASLEKSLEVFSGHENDKNYILLASDGQETCGGNPLIAVQNIKSKLPNLTVDVAGLNVSSVERSQLQQIAQAGGGNFFDVKQKTDWDKMTTDSKNKWQYIGLGSCLVKVSLSYNACQTQQFTKAANYLNQQAALERSRGNQMKMQVDYDLIRTINLNQIARNQSLQDFIKSVDQSAGKYAQ